MKKQINKFEITAELDEKKKIKYSQLAVFPKDVTLPKEIIELLWCEEDYNDLDIDGLLDELVQKSLLTRSSDGVFALHDLQVDYLERMCFDKPQLHNEFLKKLGDPLRLRHHYAWDHYIWHLTQAGKTEVVQRLLQDFRWMEARLYATDINGLLKDYEHLKLESTTDLIYRALKLSSHVLITDKQQLTGQLLGRLSAGTDAKIDSLRSQLNNFESSPWLSPFVATLNHPQSPLNRTIRTGPSRSWLMSVTPPSFITL